MGLVHNEQTKRLAANLDRASSGFMIAGFVTSFAAMSFQVPVTPLVNVWTVSFSVIWLLVGVGLHILARRALRGLKF